MRVFIAAKKSPGKILSEGLSGMLNRVKKHIWFDMVIKRGPEWQKY